MKKNIENFIFNFFLRFFKNFIYFRVINLDEKTKNLLNSVKEIKKRFILKFKPILNIIKSQLPDIKGNYINLIFRYLRKL
jgi:hypothetical protein